MPMSGTYYVYTDNGGTADGTTEASGYASLVDLVSSEFSGAVNANVIIECSGTAEDTITSALTIQGVSTTLGTYTITIRGNPSSAYGSGKYTGNAAWSTGHYRIVNGTSGGTLVINEGVGAAANTDGVILEGLQVGNTTSASIVVVSLGGAGGGACSLRTRYYSTENSNTHLGGVATSNMVWHRIVGNTFTFVSGKAFCKALALFTPSYTAGSHVMKIAHNTTYNPSSGGGFSSSMSFTGGDADVTFELHNNHFFGQTGSNEWIAESLSAGTFNATYNSGPTSAPTDHTSNWVTSSTTYDNDLTDAEHASGATAVDWSPVASGALDGAGVTGYELSVDIAGNSYNSPPDIGAFNIASSGPAIASLAYYHRFINGTL